MIICEGGFFLRKGGINTSPNAERLDIGHTTAESRHALVPIRFNVHCQRLADCRVITELLKQVIHAGINLYSDHS